MHAARGKKTKKKLTDESARIMHMAGLVATQIQLHQIYDKWYRVENQRAQCTMVDDPLNIFSTVGLESVARRTLQTAR